MIPVHYKYHTSIPSPTPQQTHLPKYYNDNCHIYLHQLPAKMTPDMSAITSYNDLTYITEYKIPQEILITLNLRRLLWSSHLQKAQV